MGVDKFGTQTKRTPEPFDSGVRAYLLSSKSQSRRLGQLPGLRVRWRGHL